MRDRYMAALEAASVGHDIVPFADLLAELVGATMDGREQAALPFS